MNYQLLRDELDTGHPVTGPYSADDVEALAEMYEENCEQPRRWCSGQQLFESIALADYNALSAAELQLFWGIIEMEPIDINGENTRAALLLLFPAGSPTRPKLVALQTETVSRVTQLGLGAILPGYITYARTL